jgi:hypothetical protein
MPLVEYSSIRPLNLRAMSLLLEVRAVCHYSHPGETVGETTKRVIWNGIGVIMRSYSPSFPSLHFGDWSSAPREKQQRFLKILAEWDSNLIELSDQVYDCFECHQPNQIALTNSLLVHPNYYSSLEYLGYAYTLVPSDLIQAATAEPYRIAQLRRTNAV